MGLRSLHMASSLPLITPHVFSQLQHELPCQELLLHDCPTGCSFFQGTLPCCGMLWCLEHLLHSPFSDLAGCRVVFSPLSHCSTHVLPSVKYTFPEALPSWLSDSAECCGAAIGASRNQPYPALGSPSLTSQRGLAAPVHIPSHTPNPNEDDRNLSRWRNLKFTLYFLIVLMERG